METEGVMGPKYEESRRRFERLTEHRMECNECGKEWHSILSEGAGVVARLV